MAEKERPVRALRFTGFGLGIWPWPLINILFEMRGRSTGFAVRGRGSLTPMSVSSKTTYDNLEEYSISEDKSGVIRVKIHRKAQRE